MGFSTQEYWSGLPCPHPGDLPNPGIKPTCPASPELAACCFQFSSVQFSHSVVSDSLQPHELKHSRPPCPSPPPLLKLMSTELVMPSNHLILCLPLLLLPSIFPSIGVFSDKSPLCIRWPKYVSLNFNISPSNEFSGLISFRIDWFDLLAVRGTLNSLLQYHSSKA